MMFLIDYSSDIIICNVIKQNESECANIDFEKWLIKSKNFMCFYCFAEPSTACISGTNQPIFMGLATKCGIENAYS